MKAVADEMGSGAHLPPDAGGRVLRRRPRRDAARSVLRRRRPRAHGLHRVRRVHDRLPAQRQEHLAEELPRPGRVGRRARVPDDDGHRADRARGRRLHRRHRAHRDVGRSRADPQRRAGDRGGRHLQHPAAAASNEGQRPPAASVVDARPTVAHELRVDPGRGDEHHVERLHPGRGHHLELLPRAAHACRAVPVRQGVQLDGPAPVRPHDPATRAEALAGLRRRARPQRGHGGPPARRPALE